MSEQKVATEVAEAQFQRFVEAMDFDLDPKVWDDEDKKSFAEAKRRIIRAMERGFLVINENGEPVYTPQSPKNPSKTPITFYQPIGNDYMASDTVKDGHNVKKNFTILAAMTKETSARYGNMPDPDLKVCQAIAVLFLGS